MDSAVPVKQINTMEPSRSSSPVTSQRLKRIFNEQRKYNKAPPDDLRIHFNEAKPGRLTAYLIGPSETIWEGGVFKLNVSCPSDYPFKPPKMEFDCDMFHPNVYRSGAICVDILRASEWAETMKLVDAVRSLMVLLQDPNPSSPANSEAGSLWTRDRPAFNRKIRALVAKYSVAKYNKAHPDQAIPYTKTDFVTKLEAELEESDDREPPAEAMDSDSDYSDESD